MIRSPSVPTEDAPEADRGRYTRRGDEVAGSKLGQARWTVVAGLTCMVATMVTAIPPVAAMSPGNPPPSVSASSPGSTTTTTGSVGAPLGSNTSTTTRSRSVPASTAPAASGLTTTDPVRPAPVGPPDVNVLLPSDSLRAAQAEYDFLQLRLSRAGAEDAALVQAVADDERIFGDTRRDQDAVVARRRKRAEALYRQLSGAQGLEAFVSSLSPETDNARRTELSAAVDRAERRRTRQIEHTIHDLDGKLAREQQRRGELAREIADVKARLTIVLDKLTAATAALTLVGAQVPAAPGPGLMPATARDAEVALAAATTAQQTAAIAQYNAAASPSNPALVTASAAATALSVNAQQAFARKRAVLAGLVGRAMHADSAPLDAVWAATPAPELEAVLFALSQVGKPYVYATAGPDTYDCSGLTKRAWAENGVGLPHFSGAQLRVGLPVLPTQLRAGDLLAYGVDGSEHVVLYAGNDWVVQAEGRSFGVLVTPVNLDPLRGFAGASRPIP